ncbi:MAG: hypothetical protein LIP01_13700 [Tannerellaceae bacterium]|nr:hypothetical protein [Tannerellaceae bacterium]
MIISNNIFYNTTGEYNEFCRLDFDKPTENHTIVFQNNCVYGYATPVPGSGEYNSGNITLDPQFVKLIETFYQIMTS